MDISRMKPIENHPRPRSLFLLADTAQPNKAQPKRSRRRTIHTTVKVSSDNCKYMEPHTIRGTKNPKNKLPAIKCFLGGKTKFSQCENIFFIS